MDDGEAEDDGAGAGAQAEAELAAGGAGAAAALAALTALAEGGDARAAFRVGLAHARGEAGLAADPATARAWCERAARAGDPRAQYQLGLLHAGCTRAGDATTALRWLRLASLNGVAEAEACLQAVLPPPDRPRTWDEADTRASVVLRDSEALAGKRMRLADYYADPCLDLLQSRYRLERDQAEEVVQEFFLELEEPLSKGEHRGRRWKDALRVRFTPDQGSFRAFFGQTLANFARDWRRRQRRQRQPAAPGAAEAPQDLPALAAGLAHEWLPELDRFALAVGPGRASLARAAQALRLLLVEDLARQDLAQRLGLSDRSVGRDLRLGAELLHDWLAGQVAGLPPGAASAGLAAGVALVPEWLTYPSADKRARLLLLLALFARQRQHPAAAPGPPP